MHTKPGKSGEFEDIFDQIKRNDQISKFLENPTFEPNPFDVQKIP